LPGVGQNLQDHPDFIFGYMSDNPNFVGLSFKGCRGSFAPSANTGASAADR